MNNLSSYCGIVVAKIRASDKDLPVQGLQSLMAKRTNLALESENNDSKATEKDSEKSEKETYTKDEKTGAWVSKDQIEAKEKLASINKKWTKSSLQEEVKLLRVQSWEKFQNSPSLFLGFVAKSILPIKVSYKPHQFWFYDKN